MAELIIDSGNTSIKLAWFEGKHILRSQTLEVGQVTALGSILNQYDPPSCSLVSSVSVPVQEIKAQLPQGIPCMDLRSVRKLNFTNAYETPETLGSDRVAAMAAAASMETTAAILVIDAGSCITYDLLDTEKVFRGGAISPGLGMRYRALPTFTGRLPELHPGSFPVEFTGNNTDKSIHAGIIHSIVFEMQGWIDYYQRQHENLCVVLTGGDSLFFGHLLKNTNFVLPEFILQGLHEILLLNL